MRNWKYNARRIDPLAHTDRRGSTIAVSRAGKAVERFHYGEFGQSGPTITGYPFRYTGQRLDAWTGLYNYKAREYAPSIGRFLQPDPLGFVDGPNVNAYVGNSPLNSVDPSGLTDIYIGGQWDRVFAPMGSVAESRQRRHGRSRPIHFRRHGDVEGVRAAILAAVEAGGPINVICHSRGCDTAWQAIAPYNTPISTLVMLDPVTDGNVDLDAKLAVVGSTITVIADPPKGNLSDVIAAAGAAEHGDPRREFGSAADKVIVTDYHHADAARMYTAPDPNGRSPEDDVDHTYCRSNGTC